MLVIRLNRIGKRNAPSYRVVLIQKTAPPKSGKFLEILGSYNPRLKQIDLKKDRIEYWLGQGIQTSDTVHNLLVSQGIIKGDKIKKKFKVKKKTKEEKPAEGETPAEQGQEEKKEETSEKEEKPADKEETPKEEKKEEKEEEKPKEEKPEENLDKKEKKE